VKGAVVIRSRSGVRAASATAALACLVLTVFLIAPSAAAGEAGSASTQVPNNSNGVNHNDAPPPANPDCTNTAGTSGTCSSPQPWSTADRNNTGANDTSGSNAYASTRNGADADNGGANGRATGKPCAGCVGKADNKNPSGQAPNGPVDHNNGYECDGNNGIGQTNPAHTGCTAMASSAPTATQSVAAGHGQSASHGSSGSAGSTAACARLVAEAAVPCAPTSGAGVAPAGSLTGVPTSAESTCSMAGTMSTEAAMTEGCLSVASGVPASERSRLAAAGFPDNGEVRAAAVAGPESGVLAAGVATQPAHVRGELAFTGGNIARYLLLGALLLLGGLALRRTGRRRLLS
jgi:hypothetical protein